MASSFRTRCLLDFAAACFGAGVALDASAGRGDGCELAVAALAAGRPVALSAVRVGGRTAACGWRPQVSRAQLPPVLYFAASAATAGASSDSKARSASAAVAAPAGGGARASSTADAPLPAAQPAGGAAAVGAAEAADAAGSAPPGRRYVAIARPAPLAATLREFVLATMGNEAVVVALEVWKPRAWWRVVATLGAQAAGVSSVAEVAALSASDIVRTSASAMRCLTGINRVHARAQLAAARGLADGARGLLRRAVGFARSSEAVAGMFTSAPPLACLHYPPLGSWRSRESLGELVEPEGVGPGAGPVHSGAGQRVLDDAATVEARDTDVAIRDVGDEAWRSYRASVPVVKSPMRRDFIMSVAAFNMAPVDIAGVMMETCELTNSAVAACNSAAVPDWESPFVILASERAVATPVFRAMRGVMMDVHAGYREHAAAVYSEEPKVAGGFPADVAAVVAASTEFAARAATGLLGLARPYNCISIIEVEDRRDDDAYNPSRQRALPDATGDGAVTGAGSAIVPGTEEERSLSPDSAYVRSQCVAKSAQFANRRGPRRVRPIVGHCSDGTSRLIGAQCKTEQEAREILYYFVSDAEADTLVDAFCCAVSVGDAQAISALAAAAAELAVIGPSARSLGEAGIGDVVVDALRTFGPPACGIQGGQGVFAGVPIMIPRQRVSQAIAIDTVRSCLGLVRALGVASALDDGEVHLQATTVVLSVLEAAVDVDVVAAAALALFCLCAKREVTVNAQPYASTLAILRTGGAETVFKALRGHTADARVVEACARLHGTFVCAISREGDETLDARLREAAGASVLSAYVKALKFFKNGPVCALEAIGTALVGMLPQSQELPEAARLDAAACMFAAAVAFPRSSRLYAVAAPMAFIGHARAHQRTLKRLLSVPTAEVLGDGLRHAVEKHVGSGQAAAWGHVQAPSAVRGCIDGLWIFGETEAAVDAAARANCSAAIAEAVKGMPASGYDVAARGLAVLTRLTASRGDNGRGAIFVLL